VIKAYAEEIEELQKQVQVNPQLAERHAKVAELESSLKDALPSPFHGKLDQVITMLEKVIASHERTKTELAILQLEVE